jgi:predicted peroxiredoxin
VKNPSGKKLEKLVFGMFDQMVEGADKYVTKEGSTWMIFTEEKRWVVEFTKDKTLWFNYNLFKSELELIGKDCTEEKDLIKNWFESRFLGIKPVEDTIQNGVKHTMHGRVLVLNEVEDTIQNGVKHTSKRLQKPFRSIEDTIQNGVRHTKPHFPVLFPLVEDTIQNGVKDTTARDLQDECKVENTIQNGVKYTIDEKSTFRYVVEDTIKNGVKETTPSGYLGSIEMKGKIIHQIETPKQNNEVEDTIQNGVKLTELSKRDFFPEDILQNGVKHTFGVEFRTSSTVENTIQNGICDVKHSYDFEEIVVKDIIEDSYPHKHRVEGVIRNTVKDGI